MEQFLPSVNGRGAHSDAGLQEYELLPGGGGPSAGRHRTNGALSLHARLYRPE